ncbi:hypothetical protein [Ktedonospora formicarum]|uniref:DUF4386 family protein n=1 Tax=Ktedonospora formicarum TaxID=2778364 RepID=A0A8J3HS01_9CHLR|nr:hypothetical protein [Ktedonospora formicarum]GHO42201.1 hypothetical protein KSX_03640 [Ktedonospora formicarum]
MKPGSLLIIGAWLLLLGGVVDLINNAVGSIFAVSSGDGMPSSAQMFVGMFTAVLIFLGLPVLVALQRKRARVLSLVGVGFLMLTLLAGLVLLVQVLSLVSTQPVTPNDASSSPPIGILVCAIILTIAGTIGGIVEGIAVLRARVLVAGIAWLFFVGALLQLVGFFLEGLPSTLVSSANAAAFDLAIIWSAFYVIRPRSTIAESLQGQSLPQGN